MKPATYGITAAPSCRAADRWLLERQAAVGARAVGQRASVPHTEQGRCSPSCATLTATGARPRAREGIAGRRDVTFRRRHNSRRGAGLTSRVAAKDAARAREKSVEPLHLEKP